MTAFDRFEAKVWFKPGCWEWQAGKATAGYGTFWTGDRFMSAHRYAFELYVGPIPVDLQLDHLCRNRGCVNPNHLEPVTARENALRGEGPTAVNARRNECVNGHPFDEGNTYQRPASRPGRECRACRVRRKMA